MPLDSSSFNGARLKVERANRHIQELEALVDTFSSEKFYEIIADENARAFVPRLLKPLPDDIPLIIGDAVHNLKSALDHLITAILKGSKVKLPDRLFPFAKERKSLVSDAPRLNPIEHALAGAKRLILETVQPYEGGDGNLYGLHILDRTDKHNQILITTAIAAVGNLILSADGRPRLAARRVKFDLQSPMLSLEFGDTVNYDNEAALEIRFGQSLPFGNEPVIPALIQISQRVSKTIELFDALII